MTLTPAFGRDYKSLTSLKKDFPTHIGATMKPQRLSVIANAIKTSKVSKDSRHEDYQVARDRSLQKSLDAVDMTDAERHEMADAGLADWGIARGGIGLWNPNMKAIDRALN